MWYKMSSNKVLLIIIVVLSVYILAQKQCSSDKNIQSERPKVTVMTDTVYQVKIDTFYLQTEKYKTVYIPKKVASTKINLNVKEKEALTKEEQVLFEEAREYRDTLFKDDLEIYSYNLLKGELLSSSFSYKLKVPREIKITNTIEHPKAYRSGLYAFGEVGGNQRRFNNISLGLQYNRKGDWFVSYRSNFSRLSNVTHHIGVGFRIK